MPKDFYDKVAEKFGSYSSGIHSEKEFFGEAPEDVFKAKLIGVSGKNKIALDVGCADGRFTLSMAPNFREIVAIDLSKGMLVSARRLQAEQKIENVGFEEKDAAKTGFDAESFNVIYSRRGPTEYAEFSRILKKGGHFVGIEIGEKDAKAIKETFGRGQGWGKWGESQLRRSIAEIEKTGMIVLSAGEYFYNEYYVSHADLEKFLKSVPIFEDFNAEKDRQLLQKYVSENTTEKGIKLPRHRVVIYASKQTE